MRLLMDKEGGLAATSDIAKTGNSQKVVIFSDKAVSSSDIFLFHKTTNRNIYDEEYKKCKATGFYDIIFQNEKGEITEGAISNIFIRKDNAYYTPPIECGLLNGVMRRHIIKNNIFKVEEKILYKKDIESADELLLTNAVRGIVRAQLIRSGELTYA
jgi:para-aminobenzoate synthetase/4-amino-4-deoxychorismate lyase